MTSLVGQTNREMNFVATDKGEERYIFLFDDESRLAMLRQLGKFAADQELSFSWYDASLPWKAARRFRKEESE